MDSNTGLLTTEQAAAALGIAVDSVRHAIHKKALPATRLGRQWVVTPEAVGQYRLHHSGQRGRAAGTRQYDYERAE